MKLLLTVLFAILMITVLGAPTTDIANLAGRTIHPRITLHPKKFTSPNPAAPLNLSYCCKYVSVGGKYQLVCGDLCPI